MIKWLAAKSKWILWGIVAIATVVVTILLRGLVIGEKGEKKVKLPDVSDKLKNKVRKAEEQALIEKVKAKVQADAEVKEIEEISKESDGKKRRERLKNMLEDL
jgi:hypothetical protein